MSGVAEIVGSARELHGLFGVLAEVFVVVFGGWCILNCAMVVCLVRV